MLYGSRYRENDSSEQVPFATERFRGLISQDVLVRDRSVYRDNLILYFRRRGLTLIAQKYLLDVARNYS